MNQYYINHHVCEPWFHHISVTHYWFNRSQVRFPNNPLCSQENQMSTQCVCHIVGPPFRRELQRQMFLNTLHWKVHHNYCNTNIFLTVSSITGPKCSVIVTTLSYHHAVVSNKIVQLCFVTSILFGKFKTFYRRMKLLTKTFRRIKYASRYCLLWNIEIRFKLNFTVLNHIMVYVLHRSLKWKKILN